MKFLSTSKIKLLYFHSFNSGVKATGGKYAKQFIWFFLALSASFSGGCLMVTILGDVFFAVEYKCKHKS